MQRAGDLLIVRKTALHPEDLQRVNAILIGKQNSDQERLRISDEITSVVVRCIHLVTRKTIMLLSCYAIINYMSTLSSLSLSLSANRWRLSIYGGWDRVRGSATSSLTSILTCYLDVIVSFASSSKPESPLYSSIPNSLAGCWKVNAMTTQEWRTGQKS